MSAGATETRPAGEGGGSGALELAAVTDIGPARAENQDAWLTAPLPAGGALMLLADGMGGMADGGVAARLAVERAAAVLSGAPPAVEGLSEAFAAADGAVAEHRRALGGAPCGTTLVAAIVEAGHATLGNAGDSRAYRVRAGQAVRVTEDHSWVAEQVRGGRMSAAEAERDPRRNIITRAITGDGEPPDVFTVETMPGDVLVLCSDGLWGPLGDSALGAAFAAAGRPLQALVGEACSAALAAGGTDNVTVIACRVGGGRPGE